MGSSRVVFVGLVLLAVFVGCRNDLFGVGERGGVVDDGVRWVQPIVKVIPSERYEECEFYVEAEAWYYHDGRIPSVSSRDFVGVVQLDSTRVPFFLTVHPDWGCSPRENRAYPALSPADGETIVVDYRASNYSLSVDLSEFPGAIDSASVQLEVRHSYFADPADTTGDLRSYSFGTQLEWDADGIARTWLPVGTRKSIEIRFDWTNPAIPGRHRVQYRQPVVGGFDGTSVSESFAFPQFVSWTLEVSLGGRPLSHSALGAAWSRNVANHYYSSSTQMPLSSAEMHTPSGVGRFTLGASSSERQFLNHDSFLDLSEGQSVRVELGAHECLIRVRGSNGAALAHVVVGVYTNLGRHRDIYQISDAEGEVRFFLNDGSYRFRIEDENYGSAETGMISLQGFLEVELVPQP